MCRCVYFMCFIVTGTWNLFAHCLGIYFLGDYKVQFCLYRFAMKQLYNPGKQEKPPNELLKHTGFKLGVLLG